MKNRITLGALTAAFTIAGGAFGYGVHLNPEITVVGVGVLSVLGFVAAMALGES